MSNPGLSRVVPLLMVVAIATAVMGCAPSDRPSGAAAEEDVTEAIRFRESLGLRADRAWVLTVASDPASAEGLARYGTPLTRAELAELDARARHTAEVGRLVEDYGRSQTSDWGGSFVDNHRDGLVVAQFSDRLAEHEAALHRLLHPQARVEVRQVRWTLAELEAFQGQLTTRREELREFDAWFDKAGVDVPRNSVILGISSRNPDAPTQITDFFDGAEWLVVESDGIGRWEGGRGSAVITALDESETPVPFLDCVLTADDPAAWRGNLSIGTDRAGRCRIDGLGATGYEIELKAYSEATSVWETVGRGRLLVKAGEVVQLRVVVTDTPS